MTTSTGQTLVVLAEIYHAMVAHCLESSDRACCGFLGGIPPRATAIYPLRNTAKEHDRYFADPMDMIDAVTDLRRRGLSLAAIYHCIPGYPPMPSRTDMNEHRYGDLPRIIVSPGRETPVRVWRLSESQFEELDWSILPPEKGSAFGDSKDHLIPFVWKRGDGDPGAPSFLGRILSRAFGLLRPSLRTPAPRLRDPYSPGPEPMWDPLLDDPQERRSPGV